MLTVEIGHDRIVELTEQEIRDYKRNGSIELYYGQVVTGGPWDEDGNLVDLSVEDDEFDFVEDIDWAGAALERGVKLMPGASIGYCPNFDLNIYSARLLGGGALIWENGSMYVESAERFEARNKTHGAIVFP